MIGASAQFFAWVQGATFYAEAHRDAVSLIPPSGGRWLDVGCGPGLVPRLAADAGFDAVGIDRDPAMVRMARRQNRDRLAPHFEVGDINTLSPSSADVVSATSLLAVLPEPHQGLHRLWAAVRPGGRLLILEATARMTPTEARVVAEDLPSHRRAGLMMWSRARRGRTIELDLLTHVPSSERTTTSLLHGLLAAIVLTKSRSTIENPAPRSA